MCTQAVGFSEFVKVISEDPSSLDLMYANVPRPAYEPGEPNLGAPFQDWEAKTTEGGMPYFLNHAEKITTWYDPRKADPVHGFAQSSSQVGSVAPTQIAVNVKKADAEATV